MEASEQIISLYMKALGDYLCMSSLELSQPLLKPFRLPLKAIPVSRSFVEFAVQQYTSVRGLPLPKPASEVSTNEEPAVTSDGKGDRVLAELWSLDTARTCIVAASNSAAHHLTEVTHPGSSRTRSAPVASVYS
jgi:hypothetical protein